ncbi:MAG: [FeFe] hydrogenase H-cluster maturation GTPase HydF [Ruminococcaceae bacterium]|nr:[FeFe] hydrogenase H-cluster maturation GTPase HydF [Oscillospiraceae bacterium]
MEQAPRGTRLHIGIFGRRNAGKSSFINALTEQDVAIVSEVLGTTADPVYKNMEIRGVGPCVLIDTAGFDDIGTLGRQRVEKTEKALDKTDIAILVFTGVFSEEDAAWADKCRTRKIPVLPVLNKTDIGETEGAAEAAEAACGRSVLRVSATEKIGFEAVRQALLPFGTEERSITGRVAKEGDHVMLVMPQDESAPKGRLILPQVQTIRELLDRGCIITAVTPETMVSALEKCAVPPDLIITDSQAFQTVYKNTPSGVPLTSFSVLLADVKGDAKVFLEGAATIDGLQAGDRVLIAEACTHAPATEDIGRVKIPALLRKRVGEGLRVDVVSGDDFPKDLSPYRLIIHCGACMFNRRHVLSRISAAVAAGVPITNYGMTIAKLTGILDKVVIPGRMEAK